jgi:two-component system, NarL family, nitrate/nitrite response regulator NarL
VKEAIRILVVDDSPGLTQELLLTLRRRTQVEVLGPVPDDTSALEACADVPLELVVVQLDRRDDRGVAIVAAVRCGTSLPVLTATRQPTASPVELALAAGACGVLPLERTSSSLLDAFHRATGGQLVLPADGGTVQMDGLLGSRARTIQVALLGTLTAREREVLTALAGGATTPSIALEKGISSATVQTHIKNILGKLRVHSQVEAVGAAWRSGLTRDVRSA